MGPPEDDIFDGGPYFFISFFIKVNEDLGSATAIGGGRKVGQAGKCFLIISFMKFGISFCSSIVRFLSLS